MPITGSCLCGQIRYSVSSNPSMRIICHCQNCRKATGSSFITISLYDRKDFTLISGALTIRSHLDKSTDSGVSIERSFCGNCGSRIYSRNPENVPDGIAIHTGTIDAQEEEQEWAPQVELYCKNTPIWLKIEGTNKRERMEGLLADEGKHEERKEVRGV